MAEEGIIRPRGSLPPPQVLALNVCDYIWVDPWTTKRTMIGMFSVIQAQQFPAFHPVIMVHAALTNGRGKVMLNVRLVDVDEERPPIINIDAPAEFIDPRAVLDFHTGAANIIFPAAGEYRVQLRANGELLSERRILVIDGTGPKQ